MSSNPAVLQPQLKETEDSKGGSNPKLPGPEAGRKKLSRGSLAGLGLVSLFVMAGLAYSKMPANKELSVAPSPSYDYHMGGPSRKGNRFKRERGFAIGEVSEAAAVSAPRPPEGDPDPSPTADELYVLHMKKAPNPSLNPMLISYYATIVHTPSEKTYKVGLTRRRNERITLFAWNPTGHDYVFVKNGMIYYTASPESEESIVVSKFPEGSGYIHGVFDWMYEEEIFSTNKALWWSPGGDLLAYARRKKDIPMTEITMKSFANWVVYPLTSQIQYPKVGEKVLPTYEIVIWEKETGQSEQMEVQLINPFAFHYLYAVKWLLIEGKSVLAAVWTNRYQNHVSITLCDFESAGCTLVADYKYPAKTWAEPSDFSTMIYAKGAIYCLLPSPMRKGNSYQHIARFKIKTKSASWKNYRLSKPEFLSLGEYDVESIRQYDEATGMILYMASAPSPGSSHLYSTKATPSKSSVSDCVTCFSANCTKQYIPDIVNMDRFAILCLGPGIATWVSAKISYSERTSSFEISKVQKIKTVGKTKEGDVLPVVIQDTVPVAEGYEARVKLTLPPNYLSISSSRPLPVLIKVYAGPGTQKVDDSFKTSFETELALKSNIAILEIDGRGSGKRGWKYRSAIYGALGTVEIEDQVEATRQVLLKYPYLDATRVSVFGWSYGGFATAHMVEKAPKAFFKCAVSVAPVSNFLFYDATYTERYFGAAARAAYDRGDMARDVSKFKDTKLLLMHGLFDDNVHFQNSAMLIEQLQINNIDFKLMVYPNQNHGMRPRKDHVFGTIEKFLLKCLA